MPDGKAIRTAVWNGRRDYGHEMPEDIIRGVGGEKIAIVQVDNPVNPPDRLKEIGSVHLFTARTNHLRAGLL